MAFLQQIDIIKCSLCTYTDILLLGFKGKISKIFNHCDYLTSPLMIFIITYTCVGEISHFLFGDEKPKGSERAIADWKFL